MSTLLTRYCSNALYIKTLSMGQLKALNDLLKSKHWLFFFFSFMQDSCSIVSANTEVPVLGRALPPSQTDRGGLERPGGASTWGGQLVRAQEGL